MRTSCRIWWPELVSCCRPSSSVFLFGWYISSSASLDIVVAFAIDEASVFQFQSGIQGSLHYGNGKLPILLQEKSVFSIVGHCAADGSSKIPFSYARNEKGDLVVSSSSCCELQRCGCSKARRSLEQLRQPSVRNYNWIQVLCDPQEICLKKCHWIPKFDHVHLNGEIVTDYDVHVIIYQSPMFGSQHFSLGYQKSLEQVRFLQKPSWVTELYKQKEILDLETIILALNSASTAQVAFERHVGLRQSSVRVSIVRMCASFIWNLFSMSTALCSTLYYVMFQCLSTFVSYQPCLWLAITLLKVFGNTCKLVRIRRWQIFYWPVFLQESCIRSQPCVEYAERAELRKNSMWSRIVADVVLGNFLGLALLSHADSVCLWVLKVANDITDNLLRTGCVWLMGVPAGFKLNTELAGILGMISLNVIQIWSTLWFSMAYCFTYFIKALAVSGLIFGATIPAAMVIDIITLVTSHVSLLHWFVSLIYSTQIQALAALWRLFRGRKWNPLRKRLDSYHYTVEQHIVGSLLFTLLLLLLPTTSVFYIFFAILNSSVSITCIVIEIAISIIHATPYNEILVWFARRRRFPCGVWFEILSCHKQEGSGRKLGNSYGSGVSLESSPPRTDINGIRTNVLVSIIHSNFQDLGLILLPHYKQVFSGMSGPFTCSLAYGVLTGKRIPSTLGMVYPSKLPWMSIPWKEYWHLCRDSVYACLLGDC